jgi:hypothetical protein
MTKEYEFAYTIPHSAWDTIEAGSLEDAIKKAREIRPQDLFWDVLDDVDDAKLDYVMGEHGEEWSIYDEKQQLFNTFNDLVKDLPRNPYGYYESEVVVSALEALSTIFRKALEL